MPESTIAEPSQPFAKVMLQILDSSIADDFTTRHVFEDLLKLCDRRTGIVDITRSTLARRLNIPLDILNRCLDKLEQPDPDSRNPAHEGRRIRRIDDHRDWGWVILNFLAYQPALIKADGATRTQKCRAAAKPKIGELKPFPQHLNTQAVREKWELWLQVRYAKGRCVNWTILFNEQIDWLSKYAEAEVLEILSASIRGNWQGLFEPKKPQKTNGYQHKVWPEVRMKAIEEAIARSPANHESVYWERDATQDQKNELKQLRANLEAVRREIALNH